MSAHDGFHAQVDPKLGALFDPSHAGVLGGLTSVQSAGERHLYFAIANGSAQPLPAHGHSDQRYNLTLHRSANSAMTWDSHQIWEGYAGYTALAPLDQSTIAVFWETGAEGCDLACALSFGIIRVRAERSKTSAPYLEM